MPFGVGLGTALAAVRLMHSPDRRRTPRLSLARQFTEQPVQLTGPLTLLDIGPGGFAAACPPDITIGTEQRFEFVMGHVAVTLPANAVRRERQPGNDAGYIAAFEFAEPAANREHIELLMDIIADVTRGEAAP